MKQGIQINKEVYDRTLELVKVKNMTFKVLLLILSEEFQINPIVASRIIHDSVYPPDDSSQGEYKYVIYKYDNTCRIIKKHICVSLPVALGLCKDWMIDPKTQLKNDNKLQLFKLSRKDDRVIKMLYGFDATPNFTDKEVLNANCDQSDGL